MIEIENLGDVICQGDQMRSWLFRQMRESHESGNHFASFLTLSVLAEQAVRERADSIDGDYQDALNSLVGDGVISEAETTPLLALKNMQTAVSNRYMHSPDMSVTFAADGEDVAYPHSEETTYEEFMKSHMMTILRIAAKIV